MGRIGTDPAPGAAAGPPGVDFAEETVFKQQLGASRRCAGSKKQGLIWRKTRCRRGTSMRLCAPGSPAAKAACADPRARGNRETRDHNHRRPARQDRGTVVQACCRVPAECGARKCVRDGREPAAPRTPCPGTPERHAAPGFGGPAVGPVPGGSQIHIELDRFFEMAAAAAPAEPNRSVRTSRRDT